MTSGRGSLCVHACFASFSFRDKKEDLLIHRGKGLALCNGSRNHGCQGCFCRTLSTSKEPGKCDRCGRFIYKLLDRMWNIRTSSDFFAQCKNDGSFDQRCVEYTIEQTVHENMRHLKLGVLRRSKLIALYTQATHRVVSLAKEDLQTRAQRLFWFREIAPAVFQWGGVRYRNDKLCVINTSTV